VTGAARSRLAAAAIALACAGCGSHVDESDAFARDDDAAWADAHISKASRERSDQVMATQRAARIADDAGPPPEVLRAPSGPAIARGSLVEATLVETDGTTGKVTRTRDVRILVPSPVPGIPRGPSGYCQPCVDLQKAHGIAGNPGARQQPPLVAAQGWQALLPPEHYYGMGVGGTYRVSHPHRRIETLDGPIDVAPDAVLALTVNATCRAEVRHFAVTYHAWRMRGVLPWYEGRATDHWNEFRACRQ
jgi:hypothetical protein